MDFPSMEDRDLMLLLCTSGIRFLGHTFDTVPGTGGYGLRVVKDRDMIDFRVCPTEVELIAELRYELEQLMYNHILGRHEKEPIWGSNKAGWGTK